MGVSWLLLLVVAGVVGLGVVAGLVGLVYLVSRRNKGEAPPPVQQG